jgi:hypothetical protein
METARSAGLGAVFGWVFWPRTNHEQNRPEEPGAEAGPEIDDSAEPRQALPSAEHACSQRAGDDGHRL